MVAWPPSLPQEQFLGASDQRQDNRVRSTIENTAPPYLRSRGEAGARVQQYPIILTGAERAVFNDLFVNVLREGVLPFTWSDPVDDTLVTFRFTESPTFRLEVGGSTSARLWAADLSLEIMPATDFIAVSILAPAAHSDRDLFGSITRGGVLELAAAGVVETDLYGAPTIFEPSSTLIETSYADADLYGTPEVARTAVASAHVDADLFGAPTAQGDSVLVSRRQIVGSDSGSITLAQQPVAGNLLVAISFHRTAGVTPAISGAGWQLVSLRTANLSVTDARQGMAVWLKTALASEPATITTSWTPASNNRLIVQEFTADRLVEWEFLEAANNDSDLAFAIEEIATGTTASVDAAAHLLVTAFGIRNEVGNDVSNLAWTSPVGNPFLQNSGANGRTAGTGFGQDTTAGTKAAVASWINSATGGEASAAILVLNVLDTLQGVLRPASHATADLFGAPALAFGVTLLPTGHSDSDRFGSPQVTVAGVPVAGKFVDPVNGSDSNPGTLAAPWKTLNFAFSHLVAGDQLNLRGGRYQGPVTMGVSGTAANRITIAGYPGENARIDCCFAEFQTIGNAQWELDPASPAEAQVYRSVGTSYGAGSSGRAAFWVVDESVGTVWSGMRPYLGLSKLRALNYKWQSDYLYYGGPGFTFSGGRIYIRVQNLASPRNAGIPGAAAVTPLGNIRNHPPTATGFNPASYSIDMSDVGTNLLINASFVTLRNIEVRGGLSGIFVGSSRHDILIENCDVRALRAFENGPGCSNITIRRCVVDTGMSPCFSWNELHTQGADEHPRTEGKAWAVDNGTNLLFEQNHVLAYFDGSTGVGDTTVSYRWLQNVIIYSWDDLWQMNGGATQVEVGWNYVGGSCVGYNGGGSGAASKYFHHNVIDARRGAFGWRLGMESANGGGTSWRPSDIVFATHSTGGSNTQAKVYNNTILYGLNTANDGCRIERQGSPGGSAVHEAYNNIAIGVAAHSYVRGVSVAANDLIIDYNLMHNIGAYSAGFMRDWPGGHYASLAAWKASSGFQSTKAVYTPGFEQNSKQTNPSLPSPTTGAAYGSPALDYRPSAVGAAATGAKNLAQTGLPGGTSATYFGAVDPAASTALGAVGIPIGTPVGRAGTAWSP